MIRRPPRSTPLYSSAASDVYKRQGPKKITSQIEKITNYKQRKINLKSRIKKIKNSETVSYTHLRAHETPEHLVCRLLLEKKKNTLNNKNEKRTKKKQKNTKRIQ